MLTVQHSHVCDDCICLPMCLSKGTSKLLNQCSILQDVFQETARHAYVNEKTSIVFSGLERALIMQAATMQMNIWDNWNNTVAYQLSYKLVYHHT